MRDIERNEKGMNATDPKPLGRSEILAFAHQARLLIKDGDDCYLNDLATEKELVTFVRLIESRKNCDVLRLLAGVRVLAEATKRA